jgi:AbrB family looped-hinge helix DNA binding protein
LVNNIHVILGQRGRTTIPLPLRKRLGWQPGDALRFRSEGNSVTIFRAAAAEKPAPTTLPEPAKSLILLLLQGMGGDADA